MHRLRAIAPLTALAVALAVGLAGCRGDGEVPAATSATTTTGGAAPSTAAPEPEPADGPFPPPLRLVPVARLAEPIAVAVRPGDGALYVAEKAGAVRVVRDGAVAGEPFLDLRGGVSLGNEQGLLGLAFSPGGDHVYVNYTDPAGDTRVVEYRVAGERADVASRRELLKVDQPFPNHNGGHLVFGPDRMLYIGLGDGGAGGDPDGRAQNLGALLGKILRIDPAAAGGRPYRVPPDNPFADDRGRRGEIWAYGLRNPWRFSFDRATGELWVADVGQNAWEEINRQPGDRAGVNYGWDRREGTHEFEGARPRGAVDPVYEYGRDEGCSVTGGFVYRGDGIPGLRGSYLFADHCKGGVQALRTGDGGALQATDLGIRADQVTSFGEDAAGELYVLSRAGAVYRITASG